MIIDTDTYKVGDKKCNSPEEFLMEYLKALGNFNKSNPKSSKFWDFILSNGTLFKGREDSTKFDFVKNLPFRPKAKECFYNSQMLSFNSENIKYFEGWVYDGLMPVEHGWCVVDGKVIDITWEIIDKKFKKDTKGTIIYFGIEIPKEILRKKIMETGMSENFLWQVYEELFEAK